MALFYDLSDEERKEVKDLLDVSTSLDEMDSTEKSLLLHLEDRAVNNQGILNASKVNRPEMQIIRGWVGYGFIKWAGLDNPDVSGYIKANFDIGCRPDRRTGGDTHVFQLATEFIRMAHTERGNRIRRNEADIDQIEEELGLGRQAKTA